MYSQRKRALIGPDPAAGGAAANPPLNYAIVAGVSDKSTKPLQHIQDNVTRHCATESVSCQLN